MLEQKIIAGAIITVSALHLALGANDPFNSFWLALAASIEIAFLAIGIYLYMTAAKRARA